MGNESLWPDGWEDKPGEWSPPPPPWQSQAPSKAFANWALALSFVPFLCGVGLLSLVFAIIVLVRSRDKRDHGKGRAIAALVILGTWVVAFVVLVAMGILGEADRENGEIVNRGEISVLDVRAGDCLVQPAMTPGERDEIHSLEAVPCGEKHDAEAYAAFDLGFQQFPGQARVWRAGEAGCAQRFEPFVGKPYRRSRLEVITIVPLEDSWKRLDDRGVVCVVTLPRGADMVTGTLEGSRR